MGMDVNLLSIFFISYLADQPGAIFPSNFFIRKTRLKFIEAGK